MANQIVVSAGAKVRNLQDVIIGTSGVLTSLGFDVANGVPKLDSNGKILVSQLPNSVMEYKGTWNAATNTPTLANGTGNQGDVYLCNVAGTTNFGAGPIAFVVGDQVIYSGTIWQRASGATGTVTSVAVTESGDSLNITGSPITTSGTINIGFNGTNLQYVNGAGNLTTFPSLITSIGLSMPSAFSVANSPLTANGTIAVTGAGVASQYIRGDGTLANFPTSGGGGSSVAYYFNSSVSQGTLGGVAYRQLSKVPIIGAGTDITIATNGYIANYITDAGDPSLLQIPAGNWNFEMFFSSSSNGGSPSFYVELYKYNGTTFTLISSSSAIPEGITNGTTIDLYTTALSVPLTTLTLTDRLAIRVYVNNSGRTITLHTENSHLCEVITTFSTGITALNGLTAQVQYFQTGTSGTDFNISSTTATHTFNIPDASATARGLITTGTQTIAGTKTFSDATKNNGGIFLQNASSGSLAGYMNLGGLTNGVKFTSGGGVSNNFTLPSATGYTFTFPNATGTLALTSDIPSITGLVPYTGATGDVNLGLYSITSNSIKVIGDNSTYGGTLSIKQSNVTSLIGVGYTELFGKTNRLGISFGAGSIALLSNSTLTAERTYTLPDATGTIAITSDLTPYALNSEVVKLAGTQTISGSKTFSGTSLFTGSGTFNSALQATIGIIFPTSGTISNGAGIVGLGAYTGGLRTAFNGGYTSDLAFQMGANYVYTFPAATGTLALTSDLSSYVPYTGATGAVNLGTNELTSGNAKITDTLYLKVATTYAHASGYYGIQVGTNLFIINNSASTQAAFSLALLTTSRTFTLPDANGTLALVGGSGVGTVTSVAALTIGTSGTDLSSTVANSTTTPVITLNVPTASATNRGALSSADWTTFNNKQSALTNPVTGTGTTNYLPKFTGTSTIGNSTIFESGGLVGIGTNNPLLNLQINSASGSNSTLAFSENNALKWYTRYNAGDGSFSFVDVVNTATRLTLTTSGNLGLGVTPSAWLTYPAIQILRASFWGAVDNSYMGANYYFDGSTRRYINSNFSTEFAQVNGEQRWYTAPSGTAGNAITFTQAMTLTASGRLLLGTATEGSYQLDISANDYRAFRIQGNDDVIMTIGSTISSSQNWTFGATSNGSGQGSNLFFIGTSTNNPSGLLTKNFQIASTGAATFSSTITATAAFSSITSQSTTAGNNAEFKSISTTRTWQFGTNIAESSTGSFEIYDTTAGVQRFKIASTGAATFTSSVTATGFFESSDMRIKTLIHDNYQTKGIASITPKLYTKNGKVELGYYAQDFVGILDSAVSKGSDDMLSLSYREVLVAKVYALEQRIKELETK